MTVRQEAEKYWPSDRKATTGFVMLQITYFYDSVTVDVDNTVKPIQDALIGLVYVDDDQVTDVLVKKRDLSRNFKAEDVSLTLAEGFSRGDEFLHIIVTNSPVQEGLN